MDHNEYLSISALVSDLEPERIAEYLENTGWHFYAQNRFGDMKYGIAETNHTMLLPTLLVRKNTVAWLPQTVELIKKVAEKENRPIEAVIKSIQATNIPEYELDDRDE